MAIRSNLTEKEIQNNMIRDFERRIKEEKRCLIGDIARLLVVSDELEKNINISKSTVKELQEGIDKMEELYSESVQMLKTLKELTI